MPMKLDFIFAIADKLPDSKKKTLVDVPFSPQPSSMLAEGKVIPQIKKKDVLLCYPYESMEPFLQLIKEASTDPEVPDDQDHNLPSGEESTTCRISLAQRLRMEKRLRS